MELFKGLLNNFLITGCSCILPLIIGLAMYFICVKNKNLCKVAHFFGMFFESICPLLTIMIMYFCVLRKVQLNPLLVCIIGFTISFIGYMPTRFNKKDSLIKNLAVNGIGLISSIFKWSFCASFIGVKDMLGVAKILQSKTFEAYYLWVPFLVAILIIFILEIIRFVIKEKM